MLIDNRKSAQLTAREVTRQVPTTLSKALRGGCLSHG